MAITESLNLHVSSVVAVIGCGGKTSLIKYLADSCRNRKVLISPSAKMFPIDIDGISCVGRLNETTGKLEALPTNELAALIPHYDLVLLEADGSRGLPCKGWREDEPIIPPYCTHTIGIVTMNALGCPISSSLVHRLPEFSALTGLYEGDIITLETLITMVCAPQGMFKNSSGHSYLLVNQAENEQTASIAREFLQTIKTKYPSRFSKLLYGSIQQDIWQEV